MPRGYAAKVKYHVAMVPNESTPTAGVTLIRSHARTRARTHAPVILGVVQDLAHLARVLFHEHFDAARAIASSMCLGDEVRWEMPAVLRDVCRWGAQETAG
jgi:hypothetical protein